MTPALRRLILDSPGFNPYRLPGIANRGNLSVFSSLTTTSASFSGTGTATSTLISTAFVGVGTAFVAELAVGDFVYTNANVLIGTILSVTDNTNAVLTANGAAAITGAAFKIVKSAPRISQINDLSGSANNPVQATDKSMPLYYVSGGYPGALFDGKDDSIKAPAFTLIQPELIFLVVTPLTWVSSATLMDGNAAVAGMLYQINSTPLVSGYAGAEINPGLNATLGARKIITAVFNGASSSQQLNEGTVHTGNAGANNMGGLTLGARGNITNFANEVIHEWIIFRALVTTDTQKRIRQYLYREWGITP